MTRSRMTSKQMGMTPAERRGVRPDSGGLGGMRHRRRRDVAGREGDGEAMKERPIIFSAPMVRALLDGTKTQTRRIVKPQPLHIGWFEHQNEWCAKVSEGYHELRPCPYGVPGDRLWVKETLDYSLLEEQEGSNPADINRILGHTYRADGAEVGIPDVLPSNYTDLPSKAISPIYMPRWTSRVTLEVTEVRIQRVQDISVSDSLREGIRCPDCGYTAVDAGHALCVNRWLKEAKAGYTKDHPAISAYRDLYESINGPGSWDRNDWVWAITFGRVE